MMMFMMTKPPNSKKIEEVCPMCKRPKDKHTLDELLICSRKMEEFRKRKEGGAGIQ